MAKKNNRNVGQRDEQSAAADSPSAAQSRTGSHAGQAHPARSERRAEMVQKRRDARIKLAERERRRKTMIRVGSAVIVVALLAAIGFGIWNRTQTSAMEKAVTTYGGDNAARNHVQGAVQYEVIPPVGGDHNQYWQNCGFYDKPLYNWHGVHSLEHGTVWITYQPNLPQDQIDTLKDIAKESYILVSPYPGINAPVIASSWDHQIKLSGANDPRLKQFIKKYRLNPKYTPELGALCTMGVNTTMESGVPQQQPRLPGTPEIEGTTEPIQGAATMPAAASTPASR
jgi:hypothetical protein